MSRPDILEPVWKPHVTVATVVCVDQRYLLVEEEIGGVRVLNQPAGHLEPDETLVDAAAREAFEETGYHVRPDALLGVYQWKSPSGKSFLRLAFAATVIDHDPDALLDESIIQALWLSRSELQKQSDKLRSPMVLQNILDYEAGARFPLTLFQSLLEPCRAATS